MKKNKILINFISFFFLCSIALAADEVPSLNNLPSLPELPKLEQKTGITAKAKEKLQKHSSAPQPNLVPNSQYNSEYAQAQSINPAFEQLKQKLIPLNPKQIREVHRLLDEMQRTVAEPANPPPLPVSSTVVVDLSPGVTPPVIRLSAGYITSMVFVDSTGAPWPIAGFGIGDPSTFNIQWDSTSNLLMVQSLKHYATGNLAVRLIGLNTPVTITLVTTQKDVDYRVDLRILGRGPNAVAPVVDEGLKNPANSMLINLLDGIAPSNSRKLGVDGDNGIAWLKGNKIYYRTKLTLLSPAWLSTLSSPDGTKVYELMTTPLLLASKDGQTVKIHLTGF